MVGCQPNAPAAFTPGEIPGTFRGWVDLRAHGSVGGTTEKILSDTTGNRSRDRLYVNKPNVLFHFVYSKNWICFHFQFNGVLKKNYNSVDLSEVEFLDDTNGPRNLSLEIEEVCE